MTFVDGVGVDKAVTFVDGALDVYAAADFVVHVGSASAATFVNGADFNLAQNFTSNAATFVNGFSDVADAATFVKEVESENGTSNAVYFMNGFSHVTDAATFVDGVGASDAARFVSGRPFDAFSFVNGFSDVADAATFIVGVAQDTFARANLYHDMTASQGGDDVAQLSLARMYIPGFGVDVDVAARFVFSVGAERAATFVNHVGWFVAATFIADAGGYDTAIADSVAFTVVERDNALNDQSDAIKVAERNVQGYAIENQDLSGKNLSGLKITSLKGCSYDQSDPPNFSRCDLTGCNMTQLTINP